MKIEILTHSRPSRIAFRAVRSRTATSPLYIIVHCRYCTNLAGLSKSKLSFICRTKCEQEENKDKWRSFAVLSVFLPRAHSPTGPRSTLAPGHELHTLVELIRFLLLFTLGYGGGQEGGRKQTNCLILPPTFALLISDRTSVV